MKHQRVIWRLLLLLVPVKFPPSCSEVKREDVPLHTLPAETERCDSANPSPVYYPSTDNDDTVITISSSPKRDPPNIWIPTLDLYTEVKAILKSTTWLNDGIIRAAQSLLRIQTKGEIHGLQCGRKEGHFRVVPMNKHTHTDPPCS